ncbi:hypothetical protein [Breznakiella homolactica]|uniref:Guanylate cyclase domain-containing protein n=1 Tax=Breznakiella homolactica TaxID=2798577 RepID=A0A7T7XQT4_9SPIR|nr:hypothetical protein [Breznakiella homolactica]QQO10764.1 hypothetical protein JFL75_07565 [Breznakiella homolactica]
MPKKRSLIRLLLPLLAGIFFVLLGVYLLLGPRLGPHYDFLLKKRPAPAIAPGLMLIDTGRTNGLENFLDPMTLIAAMECTAELGAASVLVQAPVLGMSAGGAENAGELLLRFEDEFSRVKENIDSLFTAILTGSVDPADTGSYVTSLLFLVDRSKDRLLSDLYRNGRIGSEQISQAAEAYGPVWFARDFQASLFRPGEGDSSGAGEAADYPGNPWYFRVPPDPDGTVRRIPPVLYSGEEEREYIAFAAVKEMLRPSAAGRDEWGMVLRGVSLPGKTGSDLFIPLDETGAVLIPILPEGAVFPRIGLSELIRYAELDRELYRILTEMQQLGYFRSLEPEQYPVFLYDFALDARNSLLISKDPADRGEWVLLREQYLEGLKFFFSGPAESDLVNGYEEIIGSGELDEAGIAQLGEFRDDLIAVFAGARNLFEEFSSLRESLAVRLSGAFCVFGAPASGGHPENGAGPVNPSDTEASLLFANTVITGQGPVPVQWPELAFWSLIPVILCALLVWRCGPWLSLFLGIVFSTVAGIVFSYIFIYSGRWIDPLVPAAGVFAAAAAAAVLGLILKRRDRSLFRRAYGPYVSGKILRRIVRAGRPEPSETITLDAVIVAVRFPDLFSRESRDNPSASAGMVRGYRDTVSRILKDAGAAMVGSDGDLVLAAFGSPLDRQHSRAGKGARPELPPENHSAAEGTKKKHGKHIRKISDSLEKALRTAADISENDEARSWYFGIDAGECAFMYSEAFGYAAFGHPVVRARLLSSIAYRYESRVLISDTVYDRLSRQNAFAGDTPAIRKLDTMTERISGKEEEFFGIFPGGPAGDT